MRKKNILTPTSIFITGASSGIGRALALAYASEKTHLFICGRNEERLNETATLCKEKGADVHTFIFDTTDKEATREAVLQANQIKKLNLVIANAGVSGGVIGRKHFEETTRTIFETNIFGVLNTVLPALEIFQRKSGGQIAIMSSMAGFQGLMNCPAYSASKCCVKAWGDALRGALYRKNVKVSVICPGFIKTPLTDKNKFRMPFMIEADEAALIIKKGLEKNKGLITFPFIMAFFARGAALLPRWLTDGLLNGLPKKEK